MIKERVCDTFPFFLLFLMIVRAAAEHTADFTLGQDILVNQGLRNVTTVSDLQCCVACTLDDICESVSYNNANKICQVNDKNPDRDETATTTSNLGWTSFYRKRQCREADGWHFYNGSCYLVVTLMQTWTSSESHCQALGGHLVDIQDAGENQFLRDITNNSGWYWIGLNDRDVEGTFVWSSSAPNHFSELLDMTDASPPEDCAFLWAVDGDWTIEYCSFLTHSICKAEK